MLDSAMVRRDLSRSENTFQAFRHSARYPKDATPLTFWFTGFSGAGKSTLAIETGRVLQDLAVHHHVLDGDVIRKGLCSDLGFSAADRSENIRRIAEAARLLNQAGVHAIVAVISPLQAHRDAARDIIGADRFLEIHVDTGLATCIERDPKGLYAQACAGELADFTGISAAYEPPIAPDLVIRTENHSIAECHRLLRWFARSAIARRATSAAHSA